MKIWFLVTLAALLPLHGSKLSNFKTTSTSKQFSVAKIQISVSRKKNVCLLMLWQKHQYFLKKTYLHLIATVPKNHSYFFDVLPRRKMKLKLPKNVFYKNCKPKLIFFRIRKIWMCFDIENWLWMSKFPDFWRYCAILALEVSEKHFAAFIFFVKMKVVSNVVNINSTMLTWLLQV